MPKFNCSYAYDVSCYRDFVVEADSEADAQRKIEAALAEEKFRDVAGKVDWNGVSNERVFVSGPATSDVQPSLEELLGDPS